MPRVHCLLHGVRQTSVPWSVPRSHFTVAFESWAIDVLRETDVLGATRLLGISWDEAWGLMERAVLRGQQARQRHAVRRRELIVALERIYAALDETVAA